MDITDYTGNQEDLEDIGALETSGANTDSNINVYEFGNLILADLLPMIVQLINLVSDLRGNSVDATDLTGESLTITDSDGQLLAIIDGSGDSVSIEDITELVQTLTDLTSVLIDILDITGTSMDIDDWDGNTNTLTDLTEDNSVDYDSLYLYDDTTISYNGHLLQGGVLDISGT